MMNENKRPVLRLKRPTATANAAAGKEANTTSKAPQKAAGAAGGTKQSRHNRKKLELLVTHWPEVFSLTTPRPLAVGIDKQIAADMDARSLTGAGKVRAAIAMYTRRIGYLKALIAGGARYNLAGEPVGEVTPEQQQMARENLSAMNGKITAGGDHAPDA
ncbi:proQ/FINO family protein [Leclercia sp. 119287]|uniref:ProQ/FINO family protein n=1 Tax=Leclercia sp. 119287 TaxID=2681308 RepID=UPI0012E1AB7B|nr:ProQ/FinO family protein [Leclercia sp. 119287]QGU14031.1 proQ/FINO family protein [Leclercia sp. 119287]